MQVDDKKLTQLNATDAEKNGATIFQDTKVINTKRNMDHWEIYLNNNKTIKSKILINASGPWVNEVIKDIIKIPSKKSIRLVKGSHILIKKIYN